MKMKNSEVGMKKAVYVAISAMMVAILVSGCATATEREKSTAVGAGVGAAAGAVLGHNMGGGKSSNKALGAAAGAAVGGAMARQDSMIKEQQNK